MNKIAVSICILGACVAISGMEGNRAYAGFQLGAAAVALLFALIMAIADKFSSWIFGPDSKPG